MNKTAMERVKELLDEYKKAKRRGYVIVKCKRGKKKVQLI